jgi:hypothetical protein
VAQGVSEGSILPCDPYLRAVAIDSILNRLIDVDAMMLGATMTRADVITGIIDALRHGILVPDRSMPSPPADQREITALLDLDLDLEDIEGRELQHLLSNAIQAFNEHGWNASIPAMASRIGKSKTVYYQFSVDKAELLFHCLSRGINLIAASQRASARNGSNMAETIVLHYRYLYRAHDSVIGPFPLFMEADHLRSQHRRLVAIGNHSLRLRGQRRVQAAISEGWFRAIPPNIVQPLFGSMLYKLGAGSLNRRGGVDFERAAVENTRFVFEGLDANTGRAVSSS